jgi:hypothetical protein
MRQYSSELGAPFPTHAVFLRTECCINPATSECLSTACYKAQRPPRPPSDPTPQPHKKLYSRGFIQRDTLGTGPYARADYNLTLSHSRLRSPLLPTTTIGDKCFPNYSKMEQPIGKE